MFKKLKRGGTLYGYRANSPKKAREFKNNNSFKSKYFNKNNWNTWLRVVSNFYKKSEILNEQISPLFVKKPLDSRPYISVKLFDQNITVLFDSGATTSVIGSGGIQILKKFKLKINSDPSRNICTADGSQMKVLGTVDLPINIGNVCRIIKCLVVPSLAQSFIFGCDFAKIFKVLVNFNNNSWEVQSNLVQCSINKLASDGDFSFKYLYSIDDLSHEERRQANKVIQSFNEISSEEHLGRTDKITLTIDTGDAKPFKKKPFVMSPYMQKILNDELDEMLKLGVVEKSNSPWCSPVLLVKKKNGEYRLVYDARGINELTRYDSYPMPNVDRILNSLRGAKYISSIDLRKAFWQIPLDPASREKTAFSVIGRGQFQFVTMPFGLCNAAQTQQRLVDAIFGPEYEPKIFSFVDDIIITGSTYEEHLNLLKIVKEKLKAANLTINLKKCEFFKTSLKFLGYVVGNNSLRTDPDKVAAILNYERPKTTTEIKRFMGMCSWYRRFIKNFSSLVSPINDLLKGKKKGQPIKWTDTAEDAFVKVKELLVSAPILVQPDFNEKFTIQSDASNTGLGGILTQVIDGEERVIAYASRSLSRAERNYATLEKELLGVLFCIDKFKQYIEGVRFNVITDNYSLLWLNNLKNPSGKLVRWAVKLRQHSFDLIHRKGSLNVVADALSRNPCGKPKDEVAVLYDLDIDRIDPWYDNMREKILKEPEKYSQWKVENNFVYKHIPSKMLMTTNIPEWKLLVPSPQRSEVIQAAHDPPTSGHFGFYKTLKRIQEQYYWSKMRDDILKYVRSCRICGEQKMPNTTSMGPMGKEKSIDMPFQLLGIDLVGPFTPSKKGNKWILVISDWFTKYVFLFPLRSSKSQYVNKGLEKVFLEHATPQIIICDNGPQFAGHSFKKLCNDYEVQKIWYTPFYSPQCNFVERNNRTMETVLRSYVKEHRCWDEEIAKIQRAINTAKHETTGYTPSFLVYGRHTPISGKFYGRIEADGDMEIMPGDRDTYAANLKELSPIFMEIRKKLHAAYERNARQYNLRKREASFNEGDLVWRRNKVLSDAANRFSAKLAPRYILCKVRKKISNLVYDLVNEEEGTRAGRWHIKDLKAYKGELESDSEDDE